MKSRKPEKKPKKKLDYWKQDKDFPGQGMVLQYRQKVFARLAKTLLESRGGQSPLVFEEPIKC